MKPVDFTLHQPTSLEEALALLADHADTAKVLAGGQSLVPLLNFRLARPEHLIDLGRIRALKAIRRDEHRLSIGAMATHTSAGRSNAVLGSAPLIHRAVPHIAHQAIRTRGTIGGSVAHADPAAELPAVMLALDATIVAVSHSGTREIAAKDFFVGNLITTLQEDELLSEIRIVPSTGRTGAAFLEVGRRRGDFALVGAGTQLRLADDGVVKDIKICLTGVSGRPHRAEEAEAALQGKPVTQELLDTAAESVRDSVDPSDDLHATADYRRDVAGTLVARAIRAASDDAHRVTKGECT
ncbi:FAD binding domain-containing protein [Aeromicrobium piscarium]|uniref:Xanthine dehydrogenase family protein subunit M n=1 Tax=Aeromicrobium piscarium TaxID=2590901 RepID=A0A554RMD1_9ACTN|nr:xanthine dehydrogenase family protein subunit M [Aeromicrobium piscarium]TSD55278.1 xanthine dehydrogenase family protein subunit M [Aeromicrobium piscarium]